METKARRSAYADRAFSKKKAVLASCLLQKKAMRMLASSNDWVAVGEDPRDGGTGGGGGGGAAAAHSSSLHPGCQPPWGRPPPWSRLPASHPLPLIPASKEV